MVLSLWADLGQNFELVDFSFFFFFSFMFFVLPPHKHHKYPGNLLDNVHVG